MTLDLVHPSAILPFPVTWYFTSQLQGNRQKGEICFLHTLLKWRLLLFSSLWYKGCKRDRPCPVLAAPCRSSRKDLKRHRLVALKLTLHRDSAWAAWKEHCSSVIYLLGQPEVVLEKVS